MHFTRILGHVFIFIHFNFFLIVIVHLFVCLLPPGLFIIILLKFQTFVDFKIIFTLFIFSLFPSRFKKFEVFENVLWPTSQPTDD